MTETKTLAVDIEAINLLAEEIAKTGELFLDRVIFDRETLTYSTTLELKFSDEKLLEQVIQTALLGQQAMDLVRQCEDRELCTYALNQCQIGKILFLENLLAKFHQKRCLAIYAGIVIPGVILLMTPVLIWLGKNFSF